MYVAVQEKAIGRTSPIVFNLQSHILSMRKVALLCVYTPAVANNEPAPPLFMILTRRKWSFSQKSWKRSLASHLSGYPSQKGKQGQGLSLCQNGESPLAVEDKVLSTVAVPYTHS